MKRRIRSLILLTAVLCITSAAVWFSEKLQQVFLPQMEAPVILYTNQTDDDLTRVFVQAIDSAKESITLLIFSLTDKRVIAELKKKAAEGVSVRVVCDAEASPHIEAKLGHAIKPIRRHTDGIMHLKILVVDNHLILLGSANLTGDSLRLHGNLVSGLDSKELATCIEKHACYLAGECARSNFLCRAALNNQEVELWFLPNNTQALERLKDLIRSAKQSIRIAMFTWTRRDLAHEVIAAAKRGVDVEIVLDRNAAKGAGLQITELLQANGIRTTLSTGSGLLHHKFAYIDQAILINGSANWTKSAFSKNDDCFLVVTHLNAIQVDAMNALWRVIAHESSPPD